MAVGSGTTLSGACRARTDHQLKHNPTPAYTLHVRPHLHYIFLIYVLLGYVGLEVWRLQKTEEELVHQLWGENTFSYQVNINTHTHTPIISIHPVQTTLDSSLITSINYSLIIALI